MTNAEAIELLDSFRICVAPTLSDAMSVAISALKAQEVSNDSPELDKENGELIRRKAAIEALKETFNPSITNFVKAKMAIDNLPSAEPEQTDCEYCHEDFDGYVRPIEKNSHAWLVRRGRTMQLRVCFKGGKSECDILFCPMCGRRLTDG